LVSFHIFETGLNVGELSFLGIIKTSYK